MTPTINVNLRPCDALCSTRMRDSAGLIRHRPDCRGTPLVIPCPIPRAVTFQVVLGECACASLGWAHLPGHHADCPARPVSVACVVGGATWEESEVDDIENAGSPNGCFTGLLGLHLARALVRERWGWLKSIMLGHSLSDCPAAVQALRPLRDDVFNALKAMAEAERASRAASKALYNALRQADPQADDVDGPDGSYGFGWDDALPNAAAGIAAFLEISIENVGAL